MGKEVAAQPSAAHVKTIFRAVHKILTVPPALRNQDSRLPNADEADVVNWNTSVSKGTSKEPGAACS